MVYSKRPEGSVNVSHSLSASMATYALNAALNFLFILLLLMCGEFMPFSNFASGSILEE
jgi:hypothetical protein